MDERRMYAPKVVENIISFMAKASVGMCDKEELQQIPEEFHNDILANLMTAKTFKRIMAVKAASQAFPLQDLLEEAKRKMESEN